MKTLVEFVLNGEHYGVPTLVTREVLPLQKVTPLPNVPAHVLGVTDVRGTVVPVLDLRQQLGFAPVPPREDQRIMLMQFGDFLAGFVVDAVVGVMPLPDTLEPSPVQDSRGLMQGLVRAGDRLILLLNLEPILA